MPVDKFREIMPGLFSVPAIYLQVGPPDRAVSRIGYSWIFPRFFGASESTHRKVDRFESFYETHPLLSLLKQIHLLFQLGFSSICYFVFFWWLRVWSSAPWQHLSRVRFKGTALLVTWRLSKGARIRGVVKRWDGKRGGDKIDIYYNMYIYIPQGIYITYNL